MRKVFLLAALLLMTSPIVRSAAMSMLMATYPYQT